MGYFSLKDLGQTISLPAVLEYLTRNNWQTRREGMNIICEGPLDDNQRPIVKYLPADELFSDYPLRLEELVSILSILEDRPAVEVARELAYSVTPSLPPKDSFCDELIIELERYAVRLKPGDAPKQFDMELREILHNMELRIQEESIVGGMVIYQAAFLASRVAKHKLLGMPLFIWRLCEIVLKSISLQLRLLPDQLDEFYDLALRVNPNNPDELRDWINDHAQPAESFKKNKNASKRKRPP
jgi:hypothetical protein